jgi:hypothetical protein
MVLFPFQPVLGAVSSVPNAIGLWTVVGIDGLLSIGLLWLAWQLWQLRRTLRNTAQGLESAARSTHTVLGNAPQNIAIGQRGIYGFRQTYRTFEPALEANLQKITWVLSLIQQFTKLQSRIKRSTPKQ